MQRDLMSGLLGAFPQARSDFLAVVSAGPAGAGKGTVLLDELDVGGFVVDGSDEFKVGLLRAALADGSYESWIKPAAVRELESRGERFAPMELAALVHQESALAARALAERCPAVVEYRGVEAGGPRLLEARLVRGEAGGPLASA
ncbi:MAG: hypothetical protein LBK95_15400 [Bifidobacteriaceae bacterium]|nr:hypothetical protein [Bifidobacteriaceae bacterium]